MPTGAHEEKVPRETHPGSLPPGGGGFVAVLAIPRRWVATLWHTMFTEPYREAQAESRAFHLSSESERFDRDVLTVLLTAALALTLIRYTTPQTLLEWLTTLRLTDAAGWVEQELVNVERGSLPRLAFWGLVSLVGYVLLPALAIRVVMRKRLVEFGLRCRGILKDWWLYALMFAVMLPLVWLVSAQEHFQRTYPFLRLGPEESLWPSYYIWLLIYGFQFVALEFFFRGFLVHGLRRRFGYYAVFVMMIPYCMIHFGKPMPETLGAIIAGVVLGSLSLKSRSIWFGAAIHVAVAIAMDVSVLLRTQALG